MGPLVIRHLQLVPSPSEMLRVAVLCREEVELSLLDGKISLRFVVGQWVHLRVTEEELARLRADPRLSVKNRSTPRSP